MSVERVIGIKVSQQNEQTDGTCLGMSAGCFESARAFIRGRMDAEEQLSYVLHLERCPDCRSFFETLLLVLMRRDRIREQLEKGGRH